MPSTVIDEPPKATSPDALLGQWPTLTGIGKCAMGDAEMFGGRSETGSVQQEVGNWR